MSRCGKMEQLEALVLGELDAARIAELQLHTTHCPACHHELNWLKTERVMFGQRVAREQVEQLWAGFSAKRAAPAALRGRRWDRWALAVAASAILAVGLSVRTRPPPMLEAASFESSAPMSFEEMSRELGVSCSQLQPGTGFACGPFLAASFASRE